MTWSDDEIDAMRRKVAVMETEAETDHGVAITLASTRRRLARMVQERADYWRERSRTAY